MQILYLSREAVVTLSPLRATVYMDLYIKNDSLVEASGLQLDITPGLRPEHPSHFHQAFKLQELHWSEDQSNRVLKTEVFNERHVFL